MLIEILVSALVLTIASIGVVSLLQATTRTQAELRHSSEAYALAQEDQARMASMRLASLNKLDNTRPVTVGNTTFQVRSRGVFVNDNTSTPSCGEGTSSADYVEITSVVTWTGMDPGEKAKIVSILSPSNGSLDPNHGTLAVSVKTKPQVAVPNAYVYGSGGAFAGYSDAFGCAVFPDLPSGDYTLSVSGEGIGMVNKNGSYLDSKKITVVGGDTKTENFEFDRPGTVPVNFKVRVGSTGSFEAAKADSVMAAHVEMTQARALWAPGEARALTVNATPLYPFTSKYRLYAGACGNNNPDPEGKGLNAAAVADVQAPVGGTALPVTLQLPALDLTVKNGAALVAGAKVTVTDKNCKDPKGNYVKRTYTSNAEGKLSSSSTGPVEPGLPWGSYELCASANISGNRKKTISTQNVQNLAAATTATIDLSSGYTSSTC